MPASARWKPRWPSRLWSGWWCCALPGSPRRRCRSAASMRRGKQPGWPPVGMSHRPPSAWRPRVRHYRCAAKGITSSLESAAACRCFPASSWRGRRWRRPSLIGDDSGVATVVAAFVIAALLSVTLGCLWSSAAVLSRHRAQAAADLAALAAARRLAAGPQRACREAAAVGAAVRASVHRCTVERLDVVVTAGIPIGGPFGGEARATARAGPVD